MERLKYVWVGEWLQRLRIKKQPAITCREVVGLVNNYVEGVLPPADTVRFEAHIGRCPHCSRYLQQFRQAIHATGKLREDDIAPEAKEALLSAFRNWKAS